MDEEEADGAATPLLQPMRQELLAIAVRENDTPVAALSIHVNVEGRPENFRPAPPYAC